MKVFAGGSTFASWFHFTSPEVIWGILVSETYSWRIQLIFLLYHFRTARTAIGHSIVVVLLPFCSGGERLVIPAPRQRIYHQSISNFYGPCFANICLCLHLWLPRHPVSFHFRIGISIDRVNRCLKSRLQPSICSAIIETQTCPLSFGGYV